MTPLFCAKVVQGNEFKQAPTRELIPSASSPPCRRLKYTGPEIGCPVSDEVAVRSPMDSMTVMRYMKRNGRMAEKSRLTPKRKGRGTLSHGAVRMPLKFKLPSTTAAI